MAGQANWEAKDTHTDIVRWTTDDDPDDDDHPRGNECPVESQLARLLLDGSPFG